MQNLQKCQFIPKTEWLWRISHLKYKSLRLPDFYSEHFVESSPETICQLSSGAWWAFNCGELWGYKSQVLYRGSINLANTQLVYKMRYKVSLYSFIGSTTAKMITKQFTWLWLKSTHHDFSIQSSLIHIIYFHRWTIRVQIAATFSKILQMKEKTF